MIRVKPGEEYERGESLYSKTGYQRKVAGDCQTGAHQTGVIEEISDFGFLIQMCEFRETQSLPYTAKTTSLFSAW